VMIEVIAELMAMKTSRRAENFLIPTSLILGCMIEHIDRT